MKMFLSLYTTIIYTRDCVDGWWCLRGGDGRGGVGGGGVGRGGDGGGGVGRGGDGGDSVSRRGGGASGGYESRHR